MSEAAPNYGAQQRIYPHKDLRFDKSPGQGICTCARLTQESGHLIPSDVASSIRKGKENSDEQVGVSDG
jgi:hypothetical protein